ncbi:MAG TPA: hypothetical protein PLH57_07040, partial [Oligoflexia bacterium]|nr:hypothetical protein [Oligoflexia bacterium]
GFKKKYTAKRVTDPKKPPIPTKSIWFNVIDFVYPMPVPIRHRTKSKCTRSQSKCALRRQ